MKQRAFKQVDVFTALPYMGNALAVVLDGEGLSDARMQEFARWTNLSETTFVLPPTQPNADYRLRIFTPGGELPFAGHPTLGTCHAWLEAGGMPKAELIRQECGVGLVDIKQDSGRLAFAAPKLTQSPVDDEVLAIIIKALRLSKEQVLASQLLNNGPLWTTVLLDSAETVLELKPDMAALKQAGLFLGVAGKHAKKMGIDLEVRAFIPSIGVDEDPVTGSLNASLAQWLISGGRMPNTYTAAQGTAMGRAGRIFISQSMNQTWVGGASVTCVLGQVLL